VTASFRVQNLSNYASQAIQFVANLVTASALFFGVKAVMVGTMVFCCSSIWVIVDTRSTDGKGRNRPLSVVQSIRATRRNRPFTPLAAFLSLHVQSAI
jgi:hypothetical protein